MEGEIKNSLGLRSLPSCNLLLLQNGTYSDVTFRVGRSKKDFLCHKLILMARSPVFQSLFQSSQMDNGSSDQQWPDSVVPLENLDPHPFYLVLKYIYADQSVENIRDAIQVHPIAKKFELDLLVTQCEKIIQSQMTIEWAPRAYEFAANFQVTDIQIEAMDLMISQFRHLMEDLSFLDMEEKTLVKILKRDDLAVDEVSLFNAIMRWATHRTTSKVENNLVMTFDPPLQKVLGNILPLIRFPLMTSSHFGTIVVPTKILDHEALIKLITYLSTVPNKRESLKDALGFSTTPRAPLPIMEIDLYQKEVHAESPNWSISWKNKKNHAEILKFTHKINWLDPKFPVSLQSLLLCGPSYTEINGYYEMMVCVTKDGADGESQKLFQKDTTIWNPDYTILNFWPPIPLENGGAYSIEMEFQSTVPVPSARYKGSFLNKEHERLGSNFHRNYPNVVPPPCANNGVNLSNFCSLMRSIDMGNDWKLEDLAYYSSTNGTLSPTGGVTHCIRSIGLLPGLGVVSE